MTNRPEGRRRAPGWTLSLSRTVGVVLGALAVTLPGAAEGQSLFSAEGLGLPIESMDGRARALGVVGPGLFAATLQQGDPAGPSQLQLPTIIASFQPTWGDFVRDGENGTLQGTRFPLIGLSYPFGRFGVVSASYGGLLDQRWQAEQSGDFQLGGQTVQGTDRFASSGGVAQARVGWSYRPVARVGVGVEMGQYTGRVTQGFSRSFDSVAVGTDAATFSEQDDWTYSGTSLALGAVFDPIPLVRVAASMTFGGTLQAEPGEGTDGGTLDFSMPTEVRLGASAALTNRLMVTAGLRLSDWTSVNPDYEASGVSGNATAYGAGVEWGGPSMLGRTWPIRLGYRKSDLPFGPAGSSPSESTFSAGIGLNLAQIEEFTLAGIDVAFERGSRQGGVIDESFTRATISLRVSGR